MTAAGSQRPEAGGNVVALHATPGGRADMAPATVVEQLAQAIWRVGTPALPQALADICKRVTGFESAFICAFFPDHAPVALYEDLSDDEATILAPYLRWAYLFDPLHDLYRRGGADRVAMLAEFAPDDFRESEYFRRFYAETGLNDECGVILHDADGAAIVISLGLRNGHVPAPDAAAQLRALLPVLGALTRRHWPGLSPGTSVGIGRIGGHVERACALFGTSRLSEREAEVARLVIKGHSNKAIARMLEVSSETVKVHRKRINAKLGVSSPGGLFSVFMAALAATPPGAETDPLAFLPEDFRPAT